MGARWVREGRRKTNGKWDRVREREKQRESEGLGASSVRKRSRPISIPPRAEASPRAEVSHAGPLPCSAQLRMSIRSSTSLTGASQMTATAAPTFAAPGGSPAYQTIFNMTETARSGDVVRPMRSSPVRPKRLEGCGGRFCCFRGFSLWVRALHSLLAISWPWMPSNCL